jgi:arylsulfate sulfotransferase
MRSLIIHALVWTTVCCGADAPKMVVRLRPNLPSPQPVGTIVGLLPRVENAAQSMHVYRFSVSVDGGPFHILRDFSQNDYFEWSPALYEHQAHIRVTVRDNKTKAIAEAELPYQIVSRVKVSEVVVTPTSHPLIALVSAPACAAGGQFRVAFLRSSDSAPSYTPLEPCRDSRSNNVYVAGMRGDTQYRIRAEVVSGGATTTGTWIPFHTGIIDIQVPPVSIPVPRAGGAADTEPVLVQSLVELWRPTATDLRGNVIWYGRAGTFLTRVLPGGRFLMFAEGANASNEMRRLQILREEDVAGNVLRETNISMIAEQLEAFGIHSDCKTGGKECVPGFHHEAIRLPNGHTLVLTGLERMYPAGTQGSKGPVDILGDLVVDLDEEFQVVSVWSSFDHMDIKRVSLGDEKCKGGAGGDGCTPVFLDSTANGWLHTNALEYVAGPGDLILSMPEQDWVLKIDWKNGKGTGKVLWRLGEGGDFVAKSTEADPWFSYQHDSRFLPGSTNKILLFDDGHRRKKKDPKANNRGQVWELDEGAHTAKLVYNVDLGVYAVAVGSAQKLENGGFTFEAGFINPSSIYAQAIETSAEGKIVYVQQVEGVITYRSFRVADIYSAPQR